jgi:hypothetical protein
VRFRCHGSRRMLEQALQFLNPSFESFELILPDIQLVKRVNDIGESLVVFLPLNARHYPAPKRPQEEDHEQEFHAASVLDLGEDSATERLAGLIPGWSIYN